MSIDRSVKGEFLAFCASCFGRLLGEIPGKKEGAPEQSLVVYV